MPTDEIYTYCKPNYVDDPYFPVYQNDMAHLPTVMEEKNTLSFIRLQFQGFTDVPNIHRTMANPGGF